MRSPAGKLKQIRRSAEIVAAYWAALERTTTHVSPPSRSRGGQRSRRFLAMVSPGCRSPAVGWECFGAHAIPWNRSGSADALVRSWSLTCCAQTADGQGLGANRPSSKQPAQPMPLLCAARARAGSDASGWPASWHLCKRRRNRRGGPAGLWTSRLLPKVGVGAAHRPNEDWGVECALYRLVAVLSGARADLPRAHARSDDEGSALIDLTQTTASSCRPAAQRRPCPRLPPSHARRPRSSSAADVADDRAVVVGLDGWGNSLHQTLPPLWTVKENPARAAHRQASKYM